MTYLNATVTRWADDGFPGFVEIHFQQADDTPAVLIEKAPVLDNANLVTADADYPIPWRLDCDLLRVERDRHGRQIATIELRSGVSDSSGNGVYDVLIDQLGGLSPEQSEGT